MALTVHETTFVDEIASCGILEKEKFSKACERCSAAVISRIIHRNLRASGEL